MDKIKFHIYRKFCYINFSELSKISLCQIFGIIWIFITNFRKFRKTYIPVNLCFHEPMGCKEGVKSLGWKRKRKNDGKHFKTRGREGLPIWCNSMEEITYSELNTEEKVEMIFMQRVTIILAKQQNWNIFGIFNHVSKSR